MIKKRAQSVLTKILIVVYGVVTVLAVVGVVTVLLDETPLVLKKNNQSDVSSRPQSIDDIIKDTLIIEDGADHSIAIDLPDIDRFIPSEATIPAWQKYAVHTPNNGVNMIAVVIDDLGLTEHLTAAFNDIKGPLTLAFLPYGRNLPQQTSQATEAGHELLVHLPMQPQNKYADPGYNALLDELPLDEYNRRLTWNLSRFDGFVGVNNHMGSLLTENPARMVALMSVLQERGFLFLDSLTSAESAGYKAAKSMHIPYAARDIFLDNERTLAAINAQLMQAEKLAEQRGFAIAIGHPHQVTIDALKAWEKTLPSKNIQLAPISAIILKRQKEQALDLK